MMAQITPLEMGLLIAACGCMVLLSGIFSGAETGLYCLNRLRLNVHAGHRNPAAILLQKLLTDQPGMLFMTLLGTNISHYLAPVCLTILFLRLGVHEAHSEFYTSLILTPTVLVLGDFLPKVIFERHADRLMIRFARFLSFAYQVAKRSGLIAFQNAISRFVLRRFHKQPASGSALHSRIEMYHLLHEGGAQGALSRTQLFMLERVHTIRTTRVGSAMIPINQVVAIPDTATVEEVLPLVRATPFSRLPVYRENRRQLIGLVHALDLLTSEPKARITDRCFPPVEVKYDTDIITTLTLLQHKHRRMAFVMDEAGRCVGVVTVKDLVEEIVGELAAW